MAASHGSLPRTGKGVIPLKQLLALLFISAALSAAEYETIKDERILPLLNPTLKEEKTLKLRLNNGLEAVIVSDPKVVQSAVNMVVMAGSWQDPDHFPGMAHFLEHMLFLGTSEYPEESDFQRYLVEHGGQTNAYTMGDYTSYMYAVNSAGFKESLHRFASFFKDPLFNPSGVARELNAIDQEFMQGFNNDGTREYHVLKEIANPEHPVHRFQTGNSQTLAKATQSDLHQWFEAHYSANLMHLYILSPLPIDEIKDLVVADFGSIQNRNYTVPKVDKPLFLPSAQGQTLYIETKKNSTTLAMLWELPQQIPISLQSKPDDLICYVLGHEGKDSLLADLRREGLADELGCGTLELGADVRLFQIEVKLTNKGFTEIDKVTDRVFQALKRLNSAPYPQALFDEYAMLQKQKYQYQQREKPFEWAMRQGGWLAREPLATFPELSQTVQKLDTQTITQILNALTPETVLVAITAPKALLKTTLDAEEPWMKIAYTKQTLSKEKIDHWKKVEVNPAIGFPGTNRWIAKIIAETAKASGENYVYPNLPVPTPILKNTTALCYYSPDYLFQIPRSFVRFEIQSTEIKEGKPQSAALTDLYVKAIEHQLSELAYDAKMANLDVTVEHVQGAVRITLVGFTDSIERFFPELINRLMIKEVQDLDFDNWKESLKREYQNFAQEAPIKQTFDFFKSGVYEKYTTFAQKLMPLKKINKEAFKNFAKKLFTKTYLKGVLTGSLSKESALNLSTQMDKYLRDQEVEPAPPYYAKVMNIMHHHNPYVFTVHSSAHGNAALLVIQALDFTPAARNAQQLLSLALDEAFFSELRTKQQTGYIVVSDAIDLQRHLFTYFGVQSNSHSPNELLWRFEHFLQDYLLNLTASEIPEERFNTLKAALKTKLIDPPQELSVYGEQLYKLAFEVEDFKWLNKRVEELEKMTYEEFVAFTKDFIGRSNTYRMAVLVVGDTDIAARFDYSPIKSIRTLRASSQ